MKTFVIKVLSVFTFFPFLLFTSCEDDDPVSDPTVTTVTVTPTNATIQIDSTQQFTAELVDQNGDPIEGDVSWSVSDEDVASVSVTGLATGLATGSVTVTATAGDNKTGVATLNVAIASLVLAPANPFLLVGDTVTLAAIYSVYTCKTLLVQPPPARFASLCYKRPRALRDPRIRLDLLRKVLVDVLLQVRVAEVRREPADTAYGVAEG